MLDECTSAVSADGELRLYGECLRSGVTFLSIAHRSGGGEMAGKSVACVYGRVGWGGCLRSGVTFLSIALRSAAGGGDRMGKWLGKWLGEGHARAQ